MAAPAPPPPPPPFSQTPAGMMPPASGGLDIDAHPPPGPPPPGPGPADIEVPGAPAGNPLLRGVRGRRGGAGVDCAICGKSFSNAQLLRLHSRVHSGERPYKCFCGRTFAHRSSMTAHERTHTGEKPYSCDVCHRKFALQSNLLSHKRTHNGTKKYRCEVCQKFFSRSTTLRDHMRLHRPLDNPYKCGFCNKYFTTKRSLNGHLEVHNISKKHKGKFACVCLRGGSFDTLEGLLTHMQNPACTASTYMCTLCGNVFHEFAEFLEHTRVAHTSAPRKPKRWGAQAFAAAVGMHQPPLPTPVGGMAADGLLPPLSAAAVGVNLAAGGDVGPPSAPPLPMPMPATAAAVVAPPVGVPGEHAATAASGTTDSDVHLLSNGTPNSADDSIVGRHLLVQPPPIPDPPPSSHSAALASHHLTFPSPSVASPPSPQQNHIVSLQAALANGPGGTSPNSVFFSDAGTGLPFPGYVPPIGHGVPPPLGFPLANGTSSIPGSTDLFPLRMTFPQPQPAQAPLPFPVPPTGSSAPPPPPPRPLFANLSSSSSFSEASKMELFSSLLPPVFSVSTLKEPGGTLSYDSISSAHTVPSSQSTTDSTSLPSPPFSSSRPGGGTVSSAAASASLPLPAALLPPPLPSIDGLLRARAASAAADGGHPAPG